MGCLCKPAQRHLQGTYLPAASVDLLSHRAAGPAASALPCQIQSGIRSKMIASTVPKRLLPTARFTMAWLSPKPLSPSQSQQFLVVCSNMMTKLVGPANPWCMGLALSVEGSLSNPAAISSYHQAALSHPGPCLMADTQNQFLPFELKMRPLYLCQGSWTSREEVTAGSTLPMPCTSLRAILLEWLDIQMTMSSNQTFALLKAQTAPATCTHSCSLPSCMSLCPEIVMCGAYSP